MTWFGPNPYPGAVDYPDAVPYASHPTNYYSDANTPKVFVLHTPEEPADNRPYTPEFFADPNRQASTHYFASWTGKIYQCVPERFMAIANGVIGRPYPAGTDPSRSLNRQSLSVEIEGYGATIHQTMAIGGPQWKALAALIKHRCAAHGIPLTRERIIGHYQVANNRSDPGAQFPWAALMAELTPAPVQEVSDMRLVWADGALHLVGAGFVRWITDATVAADLRKMYGAEVAVSGATLTQLRAMVAH